MVATRELEDHLLVLVNEALDSFLYDNAVFLAEILASVSPVNEAYQYLLAVCYHRSNQVFRAYHTLKYAPCCASPDSKLLLAQCCLDIGRAQEAERALADEQGGVVGGAHGLYLLAKVQRSHGKLDVARRLLAQSLALDPCLWVAMRDLCQLGGEEEGARHLRRLEALEGGPAADLAALIQSQGGNGAEGPGPLGEYLPRALHMATPPATSDHMTQGRPPPPPPSASVPFPGFHTPSSAPGPPPPQQLLVSDTPATGAHAAASARVPPPASTPLSTPTHNPPPSALPPMVTPADAGVQLTGPPPNQYKANAHAHGRGGAGAGAPDTAPSEGYFPILPSASQFSPKFTAGLAPPRRKYVIEGKMRKVSGRLFSGGGGGGGMDDSTPTPSSAIPSPPLFSERAAPAPAGPAASASAAAAAAAPSQPPRGPTDPPAAPKGGHEDLSAAIRGLRLVCSLLRHLGGAFLLQSVFRAREAIERYRKLPFGLSTRLAWVQTQLGRCHAELVDYAEAARCFEAARRLCPHRLDGVEHHSTALWQLRRDVDLSHLAQDCLATDRLAPQAWLALGNCFSLAREHEMAARMIQRALQLDPTSACAYTLCGHEYATLDDAEKATHCYRQAIRCDPRHYQAWFGLGLAYLRQEKFDSAEAQFHRALEINPSSSVLHCYRGMVVARQGRAAEARRDLDRAIQADPKNPLARFELASLLLGSGQLAEALQECAALRNIAPREPSVCFLMGRVLKRVGRPDEALRCFHEALDLKPPSSDLTAIKAAMERLHVDDEAEGDWE